jgi:DNA-damage-inducible protein D
VNAILEQIMVTVSALQRSDNNLQQHLFERLKRIDHQGQVFWSGRQLGQALGYASYRAFVQVIRKAKQACQNSGQVVATHFHEISEDAANNDEKPTKHIFTIYLSRYACYLAIQNANPKKENVAISQSYLASQRHQAELLELQQSELLDAEDMSRLLLRNEVVRHNKELASAARQAGVIEPADFSAFQNQGYMGLYNGLDRKRLHERKNLKTHQKVLDYMGSTELAANLFRVTQTEEKMTRDHVNSKLHAYKTHHEVGEKIRQTIQALGGTVPEDLPVPDKSVKNIERKQAKLTGDRGSQKITT